MRCKFKPQWRLLFIFLIQTDYLIVVKCKILKRPVCCDLKKRQSVRKTSNKIIDH